MINYMNYIFSCSAKVIMVLTRRTAAFEDKNDHIQSGSTEDPPFYKSRNVCECFLSFFLFSKPVDEHELL